MKFSLISPTFGRPEEVTEFLESLLEQDYSGFEVILGDGTPKDTLRPDLKRFEDNSTYPLHIVYEEYLSVSDGRNRAAEKAKGEYLIFMDSDCLIPPNYLKLVEAHLSKHSLDAFGGPDKAHKNFTPLQKAISFSMTSLLTTGGIRGKQNHVGTYHPRGFNMGIKASTFNAVGGYSDFRCGEDIELSMRIIEQGYSVGFIPEAFVYHKRRTSLKQFFKQVYRFGAARINIYKRHPKELKVTHFFPLLFSLYVISSVLGITLLPRSLTLLYQLSLEIYVIALFVSATWQSKSMGVGLLAILTSFTMLYGYAWGFVSNAWAYYVLKMPKGLKL